MHAENHEPLARIQFTQRIPVFDRIRNVNDFKDIITRVLQSKLQEDYDPADIAKEADWNAAEEAGWRFRVMTIEYKVDALLGSETFNAGKAEDLIKGSLYAAIAHLDIVEDNGDWQLLCFEVEEKITHRRARSASEAANAKRKAWSRFDGTEKPPELEERMVPEMEYKIHFAFIDCAQADEINRWSEQTGNQGGAFTGKHLPKFARKAYKRARVMLHNQLGSGDNDLLTATQIDYVREARSRKVAWRALARRVSDEGRVEVDWQALREFMTGLDNAASA